MGKIDLNRLNIEENPTPYFNDNQQPFFPSKLPDKYLEYESPRSPTADKKSTARDKVSVVVVVEEDSQSISQEAK